MPIFKLIEYQDAQIAVWKITENLEEILSFSDLSQYDFENYEKLVHTTKKIEWLSSRILIQTTANRLKIPFAGINKDKNGKLHLNNLDWNISISHSKEFIAAVFHQTKKCGIDLEAESVKFFKVSPRVLSKYELEFAGNDLTKHCIFWSAKEALYKLYGKKEVDFRDNLMIDDFEVIQNETIFKGKFLKNEHSFECSFKAIKLEQLWLVVALEID